MKTGKTQTEITRIEPKSLDISSYTAIDFSAIQPSNVILIQGDNKLKKTIDCEDGDFVADNMNLGKSFDAQIIQACKLFDVFQKDPTDSKNTFETVGFLKTVNADKFINILQPVDPYENYPLLYQDEQGLYYQHKVTLVLSIAGLPYKMPFISRPKQIAVQKILEQLYKLSAINGLSDPVEGIFKFFSESFTSKKPGSKTIQTIKLGWSRVATVEELTRAAPFRNIDLTKIVEKEE